MGTYIPHIRNLDPLLKPIPSARQIPQRTQNVSEFVLSSDPLLVILCVRLRLLRAVSRIQQTTGFPVEATQLDPAPGIVGIHGLGHVIEWNHLGGSYLASILPVLGERSNFAPASGDR